MENEVITRTTLISTAITETMVEEWLKEDTDRGIFALGEAGDYWAQGCRGVAQTLHDRGLALPEGEEVELRVTFASIILPVGDGEDDIRHAWGHYRRVDGCFLRTASEGLRGDTRPEEGSYY